MGRPRWINSLEKYEKLSEIFEGLSGGKNRNWAMYKIGALSGFYKRKGDLKLSGYFKRAKKLV